MYMYMLYLSQYFKASMYAYLIRVLHVHLCTCVLCSTQAKPSVDTSPTWTVKTYMPTFYMNVHVHMHVHVHVNCIPCTLYLHVHGSAHYNVGVLKQCIVCLKNFYCK